MTRRAERRLLAGLLAAAAILRFWGIDHGLPDNYVADSTVVRAALSIGAGANPLAGDELPTQYPYLLPYALFVVYGGMYALGRVAGAVESVEAFGELALARPDLFFLTARAVVALAGCGVVLLVVLLGRRLASPATGLWAGAFTAVSLTQVHLSHLERPHVVASLFVMASLLFALRYREGSGGDLVASSACAALAGATVPYGFFAASVPVAAAVAEPRRPRRWRSALVAALLFAAIALVCYPRLLLASGEAFGYEPETGAFRYFGGLMIAPELINGGGFLRLAGYLVGSEPTLALAALVGVGLLLRSPQRRRWLLVALYPLVFTLVYGSYEVVHPRYLLSLVPFLALAAGHAVDGIVGGLWRRRETVPRLVAAGVVVALLGPPLVLAARLDVLLTRRDTRSLAAEWVARHLPREPWVGLEPHGVQLEPGVAALERLAASHPGALGIRDRHRLSDGTGDGWSTVRLWLEPGYLDAGWRRAAEGVELGAVIAVIDDGVARSDPFYRSLEADGERLARFSPLAGAAPAETDLPNDLERPLVDLWRLERPGPVVEIWELPAP